MTTIGTDNNEVIETPFPSKEYGVYKAQVGISSEDEMTLEQMKKMYVLIVDAFLKGRLSIDGIASICNRMFTRAASMRNEDEGFFHAIIAGSELSFYIRRPKLLTRFNEFLGNVLSYSQTLKEELK